jgi:hypothetical protein
VQVQIKTPQAPPPATVNAALPKTHAPSAIAPKRNLQKNTDASEFSERYDNDSRVDLLFTENKPVSKPSQNAFLFALAAGIVAVAVYLYLNWHL